MIVGRVIEIWRYPVKSMAGGQLDACEVGAAGIPGDRGWAVRDEQAGEMRGGKRFPVLLQCSARYLSEPAPGSSPPAEIRLPDGSTIRSDAADVGARLSSICGSPVSLWPLRPADDLEHYRRRLPADPAEREAGLREVLGRLPEEPLPDLSIFPREIFEFTSPRGTYFDAFPLHLLTTGWLDDLARANPKARFDRRRFRPNFLIEPASGSSGKVELDWLGREVAIGETHVKVELPVVRCSMTLQPQGGLPKDPSVLRTIVRESDQNVGVYASVVAGGRVRVGDEVRI